jgi:RNase P subunit RPR2
MEEFTEEYIKKLDSLSKKILDRTEKFLEKHGVFCTRCKKPFMPGATSESDTVCIICEMKLGRQ